MEVSKIIRKKEAMKEKSPEELQKENEAKTVEGYETLKRLFENEDFIWFRENIVSSGISGLATDALMANITTDQGQRLALAKIGAYQEILKTFEGIFQTYENEVKRMSER